MNPVVSSFTTMYHHLSSCDGSITINHRHPSPTPRKQKTDQTKIQQVEDCWSRQKSLWPSMTVGQVCIPDQNEDQKVAAQAVPLPDRHIGKRGRKKKQIQSNTIHQKLGRASLPQTIPNNRLHLQTFSIVCNHFQQEKIRKG